MSIEEPQAAPRPRPGMRLAHYELEHEMGEGAMGVVFRARDLALDRAVAVKVLRPEVSGDTATVERFAREARAAARVNHYNLAHIYFVGAESGVRFFAMELVPGEDLEDLVRQEGPLDLEDAIDLLLQTAHGMAAAHAAGVVHRDLKPSNVIRRPDGTIKVTDFGLSKSLDRETDPGTTHAGQVLGTPTFMSPEQCRGIAVDARTDIYALGLTAYYLLTGKPPFPGPSLGQVINDQINAPLPRVSSERRDVPEAVDDVLARLCAKNRDDRPEDMESVIDLLQAVRPREIEPAAIAARATAAAIDIALTSFLAAAVLLPIALFTVFEQGGSVNIGAPNAVFGAAWLLVVLVPEVFWRQTFGKWMLDLEITSEDGTPPNKRTLVIRFLLRYPVAVVWVLLSHWNDVPAIGMTTGVAGAGEAVLLGSGVLAYFLTGGQTLSDILTHTRVVYSRPAAERRVALFKERRARRKDRRDARQKKRESVDPTTETRVMDRGPGSTQA